MLLSDRLTCAEQTVAPVLLSKRLFRADFAGLGRRFQAEVGAHEAQAQQLLLHPLHVEAPGVVAVVVLDARDLLVALGEILVIVEVARVARNAVIVAHVDRLGHLLAGHQRLVELLAVARAYDLHLRLP